MGAIHWLAPNLAGFDRTCTSENLRDCSAGFRNIAQQWHCPFTKKPWNQNTSKEGADSAVKMVVKDTVMKPPSSRNPHVFSKSWSFILSLLLVGFAWLRVFQHLVVSQAQVVPSFHSWWYCQVAHFFYCLGSFSFSTFSFPYFETLPSETGLPVASCLPFQYFFCLPPVRAFNVPFKWAIATQTFGIPVCLLCTLARTCGNILACSCACKWSE